MGKKKKKVDEQQNVGGGPCRVKVHIRLKQCTDEKEKAIYNIFADATQLHIPNSKGRLELDRWYYFDHIYSPISSNKEVYKLSTYDLVESTLKGVNTALFAYGPTGSGKTHSLMSKDGVTAHTVSHLFNRVWRRTDYDYKVNFSYYQLYNERVFDLLNPKNNAGVAVKNDGDEEELIVNMVQVQCETPMDVYELLNIGRRTLFLAEKKMNRQSNRSHVICQLSIERKKSISQSRRSSMHETYSTSKCHVGRNKEHIRSSIDFDTVPFDKAYLKRKHKKAVDKVNQRNNSDSNERQGNRSRSNSIRRGSNADSVSQDLRAVPDRQVSPILSSGFSELSETDDTLVDSPNRNNVYHLSSTINSESDAADFMQIETAPNLLTSTEGSAEDAYYHDENENELELGNEDNEVFTFLTRHNDVISDEDFTLQKSKISIIDLAGSERIANDAVVNYDSIQENKSINLSLLELGNVISALTTTTKGSQKHIPYKSSLLTRLLRDSLGGNCKTKFLLCLSTKMADANQSKSTLEFGQKLMKIYTKPLTNVVVDYKRKYEHLLKMMNEKEEEYEKMQSEFTNLLQNAHQEIQLKEAIVFDHEMAINSMQAQLYLADMVRQEFKKKVDKFQETLNEKDDQLKKKEDELLRLHNEIDHLIEKIKSTNLSHIVTADASTNTEPQENEEGTRSDIKTCDMGTNTICEEENCHMGTNTCLETCSIGTNTFCGETCNMGTNTPEIKTTDSHDASTSTKKLPIPLPIIVSFSNLPNYGPIKLAKTCDATTNTTHEEIVAPTTKNNKSLTNSIIVTFLQDPKTDTRSKNTNVNKVTSLNSVNSDVTKVLTVDQCFDKKTSVVKCNASTNTTEKSSPIVVTFVRDPDTMIVNTIDRVISPKNKEAKENDMKIVSRQSSKLPVQTKVRHNLNENMERNLDQSANSKDINTIQSALPAELYNLRNLLLHEKSYSIGVENTEPITDGIYGIINEIFSMLPNMLSECQQPRRNSVEESSVTRDKNARNAPASSKYPSAKDQLIFLQEHLSQRRETIKMKLHQISLELPDDQNQNPSCDTNSEIDLISSLIERLSKTDSLIFDDIGTVTRLFDLVRCYVAITTCSVASQRWQRYDKHLKVIQASKEDDMISNSDIDESKVKRNLFDRIFRMRLKSGLR